MWGLASSGRFAGTEVARRGLEYLAEAVAAKSHYGRALSYPQFWNFWGDDIKLAEIYLGLGARADEEPLKG